MRSASERISSSSSETSRIAAAGVALRDQAAVDELDRADVEAARRLRGDEHARVAGDLARDHDLLLVAARQRRRPACRPAAAHVVLLEQRAARARACGSSEQPAGATSAGVRYSRSARFSASVKSSTRPRRWRSSAMCETPGGPCPRAPAPVTSSPVDDDRARRRRPRRPVIASMSSLWPLPSTPASADDLARAHLEGRRRAPPAGRGRRARARSRTSSTGSPGCAGGLSTRSSTSRPTISRASDSSVAPSVGDRVDPLAAPQHGDAVGDLEHLVELVRDEDDRRAVGLQRRAAP